MLSNYFVWTYYYCVLFSLFSVLFQNLESSLRCWIDVQVSKEGVVLASSRSGTTTFFVIHAGIVLRIIPATFVPTGQLWHGQAVWHDDRVHGSRSRSRRSHRSPSGSTYRRPRAYRSRSRGKTRSAIRSRGRGRYRSISPTKNRRSRSCSRSFLRLSSGSFSSHSSRPRRGHSRRSGRSHSRAPYRGLRP